MSCLCRPLTQSMPLSGLFFSPVAMPGLPMAQSVLRTRINLRTRISEVLCLGALIWRFVRPMYGNAKDGAHEGQDPSQCYL